SNVARCFQPEPRQLVLGDPIMTVDEPSADPIRAHQGQHAREGAAEPRRDLSNAEVADRGAHGGLHPRLPSNWTVRIVVTVTVGPSAVIVHAPPDAPLSVSPTGRSVGGSRLTHAASGGLDWLCRMGCAPPTRDCCSGAG